MRAQTSITQANSSSFFEGVQPWWMLLLLAVAVYLLGLDGQYVPSNGDELVYTHIARLTAANGHWLPLVSELDHMRNTKPPLLFWQALVVSDWGQYWRMGVLRAPSVLYTLLLAAAVGVTVQRVTRDTRRALLATCLYLAFFCTFRFGRPFLTSAPESFWLSLPMFWLLNRQAASAQRETPGWLAHAVMGLVFGLGLAYKSFALIAPAAATLWAAQLVTTPMVTARRLVNASLKVTLSTIVALAIFGLWFALDPDPAAVWREFVVGENVGKMGASEGYWHTAVFGGGFSVWAQLLGYAQDAGLLAFVVLGGMAAGLMHLLRRWRSGIAAAPWPPQVRMLLVWLGVWLLVFTLPSQRSARYLIPAMPALAMLLAIYWKSVPRGWFLPSLLVCGAGIAMLGRIAWAASELGIGSPLDLTLTELAVAAGLALVLAGLIRRHWTRACTLAASLAVLAVFGLTTSPLNGASGLYDQAAMASVKGARIAVPSSFNGQFERFQFLLPGNSFVPYDGDALASHPAADNAQTLQDLLRRHDAVVWLQTPAETTQPLCAPSCTVLAQRWEVKGRQQPGEIRMDNLLQPQQWLFRREWLLRGEAPG